MSNRKDHQNVIFPNLTKCVYVIELLAVLKNVFSKFALTNILCVAL